MPSHPRRRFFAPGSSGGVRLPSTIRRSTHPGIVDENAVSQALDTDGMCNARRPTSLCVMSYLRAAIAEHIIPLCGAYPSLVPSRSVEGPLNAAAGSALGMHLFRPRAVVNFGIAGAHNPELKKGDLVIGKDAVDHSGLKSSQVISSTRE